MTSAIFQSIGLTELLIVLGVVVLIFGPKRLPGLGRQLGGGMREFKDSITGRSKDPDEVAAPVPAQTATGRVDAPHAPGAAEGPVAPREPVLGEAAPETKS